MRGPPYFESLFVLVPLVIGLYFTRRREEAVEIEENFQRDGVDKDLASDRARFKSFQARYLAVFWLMMAGDWLQG